MFQCPVDLKLMVYWNVLCIFNQSIHYFVSIHVWLLRFHWVFNYYSFKFGRSAMILIWLGFFSKTFKILGSWMCYKHMFKPSPVSCQKGQTIKSWKNNTGFSKLFKADSQGNFDIYGWQVTKKYFQLFFDMMYGVNNIELGIDDILQLIELTLGEGELQICYLIF